MRRIRIAAFTLAGILVCLAISHIFSVEPAEQSGSDLGDVSAPPAKVPPPPPLPGEKTDQPAKKRPAPAKLAHEELMPGPPPIAHPVPTRAQVQAQVQTQADPKPVIWRGGNGPGEDADLSPAPAPAVTASLREEPTGPVIVVPHERPKEDHRGVRWLKAVGKVLGIGAKPSPEDEAFR
jgi:hypothetical protein